MSETMQSILACIIAVLIIWLIARAIYINISMFFARKLVVKHPTQENAWKVYKLLKAKLGVAINNHPKDWAKYRDMFYVINHSAEIPSELKENIKKRLMKKGLYINNMKILTITKVNILPKLLAFAGSLFYNESIYNNCIYKNKKGA